MNIFLPPLDSQFKLLNTVRMPLTFFRYNNSEFTKNLPTYDDLGVPAWREATGIQAPLHPPYNEQFWEWREDQYAQRPFYFPAETVFQVERYHFSHSGENAANLLCKGSPDLRIVPKKLGGTGSGRLRCYLDLHELNSLGEVEMLP